VGIYTNIIRPILFKLPPEKAQKVAEIALHIKPIWKSMRPFLQLRDRHLRTDMGGILLHNPVGLAAGYDKDCVIVESLSNLGFGYIVAGTVVAEPRKGNPRPRIVRSPSEGSMVNSLGFPSKGLEAVSGNLQPTANHNVPVLTSISGLSIEEFCLCYRKLQPLASGIELNISSPNTDGVRAFQQPAKLEELLSALKPLKEKPIFLKLPPYFDENQRRLTMRLVDLCLKYNVEGVTAINTWPWEDERLATGRGGLSGRPLFPHMLRIIRDIRHHAGDKLIINGCGGISSGEEAVEALRSGANTIQLFTGFIYGGPGLMKQICKRILAYMEQQGIDSTSKIR